MLGLNTFSALTKLAVNTPEEDAHLAHLERGRLCKLFPGVDFVSPKTPQPVGVDSYGITYAEDTLHLVDEEKPHSGILRPLNAHMLCSVFDTIVPRFPVFDKTRWGGLFVFAKDDSFVLGGEDSTFQFGSYPKGLDLSGTNKNWQIGNILCRDYAATNPSYHQYFNLVPKMMAQVLKNFVDGNDTFVSHYTFEVKPGIALTRNVYLRLKSLVALKLVIRHVRDMEEVTGVEDNFNKYVTRTLSLHPDARIGMLASMLYDSLIDVMKMIDDKFDSETPTELVKTNAEDYQWAGFEDGSKFEAGEGPFTGCPNERTKVIYRLVSLCVKVAYSSCGNGLDLSAVYLSSFKQCSRFGRYYYMSSSTTNPGPRYIRHGHEGDDSLYGLWIRYASYSSSAKMDFPRGEGILHALHFINAKKCSTCHHLTVCSIRESGKPYRPMLPPAVLRSKRLRPESGEVELDLMEVSTEELPDFVRQSGLISIANDTLAPYIYYPMVFGQSAYDMFTLVTVLWVASFIIFAVYALTKIFFSFVPIAFNALLSGVKKCVSFMLRWMFVYPFFAPVYLYKYARGYDVVEQKSIIAPSEMKHVFKAKEDKVEPFIKGALPQQEESFLLDLSPEMATDGSSFLLCIPPSHMIGLLCLKDKQISLLGLGTLLQQKGRFVFATAAHVLKAARESVKDLADLRWGAPVDGKWITVAFDAKAKIVLLSIACDVSFLELPHSVVSKLQRKPMSVVEPSPSAIVTIIGYSPKDGGWISSRGVTSAHPTDRRFILTHTYTLEGFSGSALIEHRRGVAHFVGIHLGASPKLKCNYGVLIGSSVNYPRKPVTLGFRQESPYLKLLKSGLYDPEIMEDDFMPYVDKSDGEARGYGSSMEDLFEERRDEDRYGIEDEDRELRERAQWYNYELAAAEREKYGRYGQGSFYLLDGHDSSGESKKPETTGPVENVATDLKVSAPPMSGALVPQGPLKMKSGNLDPVPAIMPESGSIQPTSSSPIPKPSSSPQAGGSSSSAPPAPSDPLTPKQKKVRKRTRKPKVLPEEKRPESSKPETSKDPAPSSKAKAEEKVEKRKLYQERQRAQMELMAKAYAYDRLLSQSPLSLGPPGPPNLN